MRIAAIDVGSNSIHMIIAEADVHGGITTLWRMKEMVGLGRSTFPARNISREAIDRGVAAMARFAQAAQQRGCEKVVAVATSAVREAANGGDFIERLNRQFNIDVRVISGREEARLIYLGVRQNCSLSHGPHLIIDIGGGSVEFIVADSKKAILLESRKLGAARMTASFVKSDPISDADHAALLAHYDKELRALAEQILALKPQRAIGTSGTLENLALLCTPHEPPSTGGGGAERNGNGDAKPAAIDRANFDPVLAQLLKSDSRRRAQMHGLDEGRREQVVAGAILVDELFRRLKLRRIQMCKSALREGILVDYLSRHLPDLAIRQQVPDPRLRSVIALARRSSWHRTHSEQVARLCMRLFDDTRALHGLGTPERELIEYAALLHDIGWHIGRSGHHKHSMYLIQNGDLKNFAPDEVEVIANIARYHRKSPPKQKHPAYAKLSPRNKKVVCTGAALLRLADGLDRSHSSVVRDLKCRVGTKDVRCLLTARWDAQLEVWGASRKADLFDKLFKRPITFEVVR
ncbi:MAG TPA: Ppx/GppA phosphatase family protein [Tepidisphaeraceae bacterium]|nr:Ppx/GppA phosphatase family protein [Tepidisphaeraceae bacterium]